MTLYPKLILEALAHVRYPGTGVDVVSSNMVEDNIRIEGNKVSFSLVFAKQNDPFAKSLVKACEQAIHTYIGSEVEIVGNIAVKFAEASKPVDEKPLKGVKHIVAVYSGKGGVGKSTIAANLAVAMSNLGFSVGLLDADIYGPSIPKMFGVEEDRPTVEVVDGKEMIQPIVQYGIKVLSIGFFVDQANALVWRGPMAGNALKQLINDTAWGELDYLFIDMPPGTGDIHLTLVQTVDLSGVIVVGTPQEVALADVRKGINMFTNDKINVRVLGVVENMAWFTPAELPQNKYYIFGKEGCKRLAEEMNVPLLGQIPLVQSICESGDAGSPISLNDESPMSIAFQSLAQKVHSILGN
ncbi:MAG: Mrp/NBP35 family ATP-binding protein [Bacteroidota bacterium]|nr:Mrp/NBP35 family ATP-binding protein [Bacteroidota bacterium]